VTAAVDVCASVIYLDDVVSALRDQGISVEAGFVGAGHSAGRPLTIELGRGPTSLSCATLAWQPVVGWSLTSRQRRPRQWVLPLGVQPNPDAIVRAVKDVAGTLRILAVANAD
jgi:hypothetical protein